MKRNFTIVLSTLGILSGALLTSCSQEDVDMPSVESIPGIVLVKDPKIMAYSGNTFFRNDNATTRSVDIDVTPGYISFGSDEQKDVAGFFTNNDKLRLKGENPEGGQFLSLEEAFDGWKDYWVQTVDYVNTNDDYHAIKNIGIWNYFDDSWDIRNWKESDNYYFDGGLPDNNGHNKLFVTNYGVTRFDRVKYENWPIVDFSYTTYLSHEMAIQERGQYAYIFGKKPGIIRGIEGTPSYRIAKIDGYDGIYVAFYSQILDYYNIMAAGGSGASGGEGSPRDFGDDMWDVIIKLTKIEELCKQEDCGHPIHKPGNCTECVTLGKTNACTENVQEPESGHKHNNEVEVNLHGIEKNGPYLESHLSLHLRYAGDVEVFIPVPAKYTCEPDDMAIVMKHEIDHMIHDSSFILKDSNLTVSMCVKYEDDGIRITTQGVTQQVIDWCAEKCDGDGITFEIWNYYNDPEKVKELPNGAISLEELVDLLNKATIKFLGVELPDYYINSFGKDLNSDCTVTIVEEQENYYNFIKTGSHLNGSENNRIYEKKN